MLETVDLSHSLSKEEYKPRLSALQSRLYALEWACSKGGVPSAIVFEGWGGAGKGEVIKVLTEKLDPRGYVVYPVVPPNTEEGMKPWMARFWKLIPAKGEMAIYDCSWYGRVLWDRLSGATSDRKLAQAFQDIRDFESMLADDGMIFTKLWLHLSQKEQARRLKKMEKDPLESWKVSESDRWQNRRYDKVVKAVEAVLDQTSTEYAPWTLVEMEDRYFGRVKVLETVAKTLYAALKARGAEVPPEAEPEAVPEAKGRDRLRAVGENGGEPGGGR